MTDDVFDLHIAKAVSARERDLSSAADILATIRSRGRRGHRGRTAFIAAGAVVIVVVMGSGLAVASAFGAFRTVPTHIHVTQPESTGGSGQGINGLKVGQQYTTSLEHAKAVAGFQILSLGERGTLQSVTVHPPLTRSNGQPAEPGEILKPSIALEYLVNGTTVRFIEDPVTPGSSLQFSVKWYGAATTHQASVDGIQLIWEGADDNNVSMVAFQTISGTLVYMTSGTSASSGPTPAAGTSLSLAACIALIEGMS
jgi:hypothetical protein